MITEKVQSPMAGAEVEVLHRVCSRCYQILDTRDAFCRRCGEPLSAEAAAASEAAWGAPAGTRAEPPRPRDANPWIVVPLVLALLGPLGLPIIWRNRRIPLVWKTALTAALVGLTVWGICEATHTLHKALAPLDELHKALGR